MVKTCDICGQEFEARSSRQHSCNRVIKAICLVCGEEFETKCCVDKKSTCSKLECRRIGSTMMPLTERVCKGCGEIFYTNKQKQWYCGQAKVKQCVVCGKDIEYICQPDVPETCGVECQTQLIKSKRVESVSTQTRICKWCGKEFIPTEWRDLYCDGPHYKKCVICGNDFEVVIGTGQEKNETCSKECMTKLMSTNHDFVKGRENYEKSMKIKYGTSNPMEIPGVIDKIKQTNQTKYGSAWYTQTQEYKDRVIKTNIEKYGTEYYLGSKDSLEKRKATSLSRYGVDNPAKSVEIKAKMKQSFMEIYGVDNPLKTAEIKAKATRNSKLSSLEKRICALLDNYNIEYVHHYFLRNGNISHEFDFYLPNYKLLIDADGLYYHSYLDDPDGERVREDYDTVRSDLIPEDHRFHLIVEGKEDNQVKNLVTMLESLDRSFSEYDSDLFKWCRSIEFPYPKYSDERMMKDFNNLKRYTNNNYIPQCRLGQSILKNFHRSIYNCRVGNYDSPLDAWYDDSKLKQVIRNRLIYKNDVDPSKILAGFNISKIAPCVSTFNPVLTKYLILKYASEFSTIFDPFSGFSGRLIGTAACDKGYVGQDLNDIAVKEANSIIEFFKLAKGKYSVNCKDVLESDGEYECLLTCPPYYKKEIYNNETEFKTCDEWIQECLSRFNCRKYIFVVDTTDKFRSNVVEEIKTKSHFNTVSEYVVIIEN